MNDATHRELRELLGWYAVGRADEAEQLRVRAHLDGCAACRAELAGLLPVVDRLRDVDPDRLDDLPTPPPDLGEAVVRRVLDEARTPSVRTVRTRWAVTAGVAAAAVGIGVGWWVKPDPAGPPTETVAVTEYDRSVRASARLIAHTWGVEIVMTASGFAPGETYRVQLVSVSGQRSGAGEFVGTGSAQMRCNLNSGVLRADAAGFEVLDPAGEVVVASTF